MKNYCLEHDRLASRLKHLVTDRFRLKLADPDSITDDQPLIGPSLGLDSLDAIELAMCVEEEFGITIPNQKESLQALASIESLAGYIRTRTEAALPVSPSPNPAYTLLPST